MLPVHVAVGRSINNVVVENSPVRMVTVRMNYLVALRKTEICKSVCELDYMPMLSKEQIRYEYHRLAETFSQKPYSQVLAECEQMVKKYYSCYPFLQQMLVLFVNHLGLAPEESLKERVLTLSFELCEHILAGCKDVGICNNVVALKGLLNLQCGRAELVIEEIAEETLNVNVVDDKGTLLTLAYLMAGKLEDAGKAAQIGMYRSLMDLIGYGMHLLQAKGEDKEYGGCILERLDQIMDAFSVLKLNPNVAAGYEYQAAVYLGSQGRLEGEDPGREEMEEKIFERLERYLLASKQLFADDLKLHGDDFFFCLDDWFGELELGVSSVRSQSLVKESVLQGFEHPVFTKLKDQKRLKKMMEEF